jgi:hypothetical protein
VNTSSAPHTPPPWGHDLPPVPSWAAPTEYLAQITDDAAQRARALLDGHAHDPGPLIDLFPVQSLCIQPQLLGHDRRVLALDRIPEGDVCLTVNATRMDTRPPAWKVSTRTSP